MVHATLETPPRARAIVLLALLLAAPGPALGHAAAQARTVEYQGDSAVCTGQAIGASRSEALEGARRQALALAAGTRATSVRYVSYLHMTNDASTSGQQVVVSADASFHGARWSETCEPAQGGGFEARATLTVAREQIDPSWRIEQLESAFAGEELLAELRRFRATVSSWEDPGAEDHVLGVLLAVSNPPDVAVVTQAIELKERLGEWNRAFHLANTYLDKVDSAQRPTLQRVLDRYQAEAQDLLPRLEDLDEYLALDGLQVVRLAELVEERWLRPSEYERVVVRAFDGRRAPWVAVYRHLRTGLEFSLIPASKKAQVLYPMLVARSECSEAAFDALSRPQAARAGMMPRSRINAREALEWCAQLGFDLPTQAQWRYACEAGGLSTQPLPANNLGSGQPRPIASGLDGGNAFGLQDMLGNVAEWCRPERESERWPLAGGSYKDASASASSAQAVDAGWSRAHYGFRPVVILAR